MASHPHHGTLGRNPSSSTPFTEHHGYGLPVQGSKEILRHGARFDRAFVRRRIADEGSELGRCQIGNGEKMARCERRDRRGGLGRILSQAIEGDTLTQVLAVQCAESGSSQFQTTSHGG